MNKKEKIEKEARNLANFLVIGFNRKIKLQKLQKRIKKNGHT